jgi:hypothetical protein
VKTGSVRTKKNPAKKKKNQKKKLRVGLLQVWCMLFTTREPDWVREQFAAEANWKKIQSAKVNSAEREAMCSCLSEKNELFAGSWVNGNGVIEVLLSCSHFDGDSETLKG